MISAARAIGPASASTAFSLSWALSLNWRRMRSGRSTASSDGRAVTAFMAASFYRSRTRRPSRRERVAYPFDPRRLEALEQNHVEPARHLLLPGEVVAGRRGGLRRPSPAPPRGG